VFGNAHERGQHVGRDRHCFLIEDKTFAFDQLLRPGSNP
jgi:hypothetical protein